MNRRNYQRELEAVIKENESKSRVPRLLLHSCCAPCSSYVLEYLHEYFDITVLFYNPNISEQAEYDKRKQELIRYIHTVSYGNTVQWIDCDHEPEKFEAVVTGYEKEPERGKRCYRCYHLRLSYTAAVAEKGRYDYFCTTLSISPHKNADWLMEIGETLAKECGVAYLPSDFKKKNGYKRSIELSKEYGLYRQNFCGCIYSRMAAAKEQ